MIRKAFLTLVILSTVGSEVQAGGPRDHEPGFFLRLSTGVGGAQTERDAAPSGKTEYSGLTGDPNFAIGGTLTRNLALHGTLFGWSTSDPAYKVDGVEVEVNNDAVFIGALGIGITYYVMPLNLYLSPTIGIGRLVHETSDTSNESDTGVAFDFTVGKEWWVSDRWALGVAGALGLHAIPDDVVSEDWKGSSFAIRFTSTFN
jgi:hypothetical protein